MVYKYSCKNCHKQFGQGFPPPTPPFWTMPKYTRFLLARSSPQILNMTLWFVIEVEVEIEVTSLQRLEDAIAQGKLQGVSHVCHKDFAFQHYVGNFLWVLQKWRNCNFIACVDRQYNLHKHWPFGFLKAENMVPIQRWQGFSTVINTKCKISNVYSILQ